MKPMGLEATSEVYKTVYRAAVAAGKSRTKACKRELVKLGQIGTEKPMETQMVMRRAKKDYLHDLSQVEDNPINRISQRLNYYKSMLEVHLSKGFREAKKAITDSAKELYPRTYKQRAKLISQGKVSIENPTDTATRLNNMNIKPETLLAE
ncbi:MAG: hypothetical protein K6E29_09180 [Cyanobacteria bacterium RUI128]|nr:hypothetical protein [Cyanobacteria bacterium RUI128]